MVDVTTRQKSGWWVRLAARLGGDAAWEEVEGHFEGDIRSERPLRLPADARVTGNVCVPLLVVEGTLDGQVVAGDVTVSASGHIMGDVYATRLVVEAGGEIQGWLTPFDGVDYEGLLAGRPWPNGEEGLPQQPSSATVAGADEHRHALSRLRDEAMTARLAQARLEETLDERVHAAVGEEMASAQRLGEELAALREKLETAEREQAALAHTLIQRDAALAQRETAVAELRDRLAAAESELRELTTELSTQSEVRHVLEKRQGQLDVDLKAERVRADVMAARVNNLESALQASLQRTSEQQEALVRWQELAEVSEVRILELEDEQAAMTIKVAEQRNVAQLMREKKEKVERALEEAQSELVPLRQRLLSTTPANEAAKAALGAARSRITDLESQLAETGAAMMKAEDGRVEAERALAEGRQRLARAEKRLGEQEEGLFDMASRLADAEAQTSAWQENVGRMTALLFEAETRLKEQLAKEEATARALQSERMTQADAQRQKALQLEAMEAEIAHYDRELIAQRQRLSETQSLLVERDVALAQANQRAEKQLEELSKVRQLATNRIRRLEAEVTQARRQIEALEAVAKS